MTSTDKFSIVDAGGGLVGSVNLTEHLSRNGREHFFDFGDCQPPPSPDPDVPARVKDPRSLVSETVRINMVGAGIVQ